jgi:hypothetical protein
MVFQKNSDVTVRDIRDAISAYGKQVNPTSDRLGANF